MRTEIRVIGQNMMNQIIELLNISRNCDCLFEMEELTIEGVLLVTLKAAIDGRAKINPRGPLKGWILHTATKRLWNPQSS
jgi:hypothetical protein